MKNNFNRNIRTYALLVLSLLLLSIGGSSCGGSGGVTPQDQSPQINVSSRNIVNGNVILNNALDQTVSVQNTGTGDLNVGYIAQANPLASPFSIVNDTCSGRTIPAAGKCIFQIRFLPTSQGSFSDSFDIPSNAANENSVTVNVSGSGKALRVTINQVKTDQCGSGILQLLITVLKANSVVSGLTTSNFTLNENGSLKTVANVSLVPPPPAPLSISLVLDYSTSLNAWISNMESAANSVIGTMGTNDEASIIKFATVSEILSFGDQDVALNEINNIPYTGDRNETHLYDTVLSALNETGSKTGSIRAIVVISDGRDDNSTSTGPGSVTTLSQVIAAANENNIAIFTIGLGNVDGEIMNQLAAGTGGQFFYAQDASQLNYSGIQSTLSSQYSLMYTTSSHGSILLDLAVDSNGDKGEVSRQIQGCP